VTLFAFVAERHAEARLLLGAGQQSIDIFCSSGPQQQTRSTECGRGRMGQTEGRTQYRYVDLARLFRILCGQR